MFTQIYCLHAAANAYAAFPPICNYYIYVAIIPRPPPLNLFEAKLFKQKEDLSTAKLIRWVSFVESLILNDKKAESTNYRRLIVYQAILINLQT